MDSFFNILEKVDDFYWMYVGFSVLLITGFYLTIRTRFYQFRMCTRLGLTFQKLIAASKKGSPGISPFRLYFTSIGGTVGLGNIVAIVTALLIGGPGALFWLWAAACSGMLIKYADVYLGMKYRQKNAAGGFDGGPMYTIPHAFKGKLGVVLAHVAAVLLCFYGVEVYQFTVITDTLEGATGFNREWIIGVMLVFSIYIAAGGVRRLANICSVMMPVLIVGYVALCMWVICTHYAALPEMLLLVVKSAFVGHAPLGGFAGSTFWLAAQQGAAQGVYSGDIAIGFDAIVQSESKVEDPQQQARLAILSIFTDAFICTMSILVVMVTGLWEHAGEYKVSEFVAKALSTQFPHINSVLIVVIFLAGFTTIQAYFVVGLKSAQFLMPRFGRMLYFAYAIFGFWFFAHYDQSKILVLMNLSGGLLILINLSAILRLRKKVDFKFSSEV